MPILNSTCENQTITFLFLYLFITISIVEANESIPEHFKCFESFVNKTWTGVLKESSEEKPSIDIARWEFILNKKAIRIRHSVNEGEYGGETIIVWNKEKKLFEFYYFTNAGFFTQGTAEYSDNKIVSREFVTGNQKGVTEVKSTDEILTDGKLHTKAQYFQNDGWVDGHEILYVEDSTAKVILK